MKSQPQQYSTNPICQWFGVSRQGYYQHKRLMDIHIGRDRLFEIMRAHQMLVQRRKRYTRTTDSRHPFRYYPNLIKDIKIDRPGQVYVSDITYIHTLFRKELPLEEGFQYLALVTDYYSRKIVGYDLSSSLSIDGSLRALKMALRQTRDPSTLIHHSDRGIQYCCKAYINLLRKHGIRCTGSCL